MEEVTTDDVTGANDSAEFNISKMTAEKIRQVKITGLDCWKNKIGKINIIQNIDYDLTSQK